MNDVNKYSSHDRPVKIVPSTEEYLQSLGLDVTLDDETINWLEQLKLTWLTWKKSKVFNNQIEVFFKSIPDPFRITLIFILKCGNYKECKPNTLPYCLVETLRKWAQENKVSPSNNLKLPAFQFVIQQRNPHFLNLLSKTYELSSIKSSIIPTVKEMIKNDNCKQASAIVLALELFEEIPVETILFPLILQDKINTIDDYLSQSPSQVLPLLKFLDNLLDKSIKLREYVQSYLEENKICNVNYNRIHHKPMGKLVARLCNKFNIPIETCKNLSKNRTTGGLRYLVHQKYQENNVSSTVWDDLVKDSLKQNADSAQDFIDLLTRYDKAEALKWAEYLNMAERDLPMALKATTLEDTAEENWDVEKPQELQEYYKIDLPREQIIMIDSSENFKDMIKEFQKHTIVSIDCEWKPSFGAVQSQVALIQVATLSNVYLIDTLILNKEEHLNVWQTFNKTFLENAEIIKLGFGLEQDFKEIRTSIVGMSNVKVSGEGLLDLSILWKNLLNSGLRLPISKDSGNSLSSLVQCVFGLPLEKSEQCSNWELRPLRETQIIYAALDAYVLLQIYYFLQNICMKQNLNFEEICNNIMTEVKSKSIRKLKVAERLQANLVLSHNFKMYENLKFLVDANLSYLMTYLRYCGFDTTVISITLLWHDVIQLALDEDRFILLSKCKYSPTLKYPQSSILDVGKGPIMDQLRRIFTKFNLDLKQNDLLKLCLNCNKKKLKRLDSKDIIDICNNFNEPAQSSSASSYPSDGEDDEVNYDDFLSDSDTDTDLLQPVKKIYPPKVSMTSKQVPIDISNPQKLLKTNKLAILCEDCGKLYWEGDDLTRTVSGVIFQITNLSIW